MEHVPRMTVAFRCPAELESILPRPIPAVQGLPDWFKAMPQKAFSAIRQKELMTMKKCPPVIDAMAYGFLMPLTSDVKVENGEFSWNRDVPGAALPISPIHRSPTTTAPRSQARRSLMTTNSSSNSITFGRSKRRPAIRCCSHIR